MLIIKAEIVENIHLAENIWRMSFRSPEIVDQYIGPGQFVSIQLDGSPEHPIRRPMSIAAVNGNNISIIYKIFGSVTSKLSTLQTGSYIDVLGPLGNTFTLNINDNIPILIGGGVGLAPILNLFDHFKRFRRNTNIIIGAKNSNEHFLEHNADKNLYLCTDDGSLGIKGTVIEGLNILLKEVKYPFVYACGPERMLKALKEFLSEFKIPGQFSVESYMACGFGFCQGCAIHNNKNSYSLVCKEGPIFNYNEVSFD